jgi:excisionase family DNA binding protein
VPLEPGAEVLRTETPTLPNGKPSLLTVEQAAEELQIGRGMVYRLIGAGELPVLKIGSLTRIPTTAIADYISRNQVYRG